MTGDTTMNHVSSMIGWDSRLQYRYGFYAVYALIATLYVVQLWVVPEAFFHRFHVAILFADPGFVGFVFIGALVLFEKNEGVLDTLVTSPLTIREYLFSKVLTLTVLAVLVGTVITVLTYGVRFNPVWFVLGIGLTSTLFVLVGFIAVSRFDSLNAYFVTAVGYITVLQLPLLDFFGFIDHPVFYLFPTQASLLLIEAAFQSIELWQFAYSLAYLGGGSGIAYVFARRAFVRHIIEKREAGGTSGGRAGVSIGLRSGLLGSERHGPVGSLLLTDLKSWVRDPLLLFIGVSPLLMGVAGRWGVPALASVLAGMIDLRLYYPLIVVLVLLTIPTMFGLVAGFFILDERDQEILTVIRITPLTGRGYLVYRGVLFLGLSFVFGVLVVPLMDLVAVPLTVLVPVAAVGALFAAITALLMAALASNTVEGVAVSRVAQSLTLPPIVALVFVPEPWQFIAGVFPPYWPVKAFMMSVAADNPISVWFWGYLAIGVVFQLGVIRVLGRRFLYRDD